jgi:branched-chain amino acid aminotransferase
LKVWLNGELVDETDARISPSDRGFLLGDGVFETLRTYNRRPVTLPEHLERLEAGARVLGIMVPDRGTITKGVQDLISSAGGEDLRVRITVTSGPGPAGLRRGDASPTLVITASPLTAWPDRATAVIAPWSHDEHSPLAGVKTTSRADTVLAMLHAREQGVDEVLFFNHAGNLCEATTANVFAVRAGRVETPPLRAGCLAGITRENVLRVCEELAIEAVEVDLPRPVLDKLDEMFLTSSTREVQALVAVDGRPVGGGVPGPVTGRLREELSRRLESLPGPAV